MAALSPQDAAGIIRQAWQAVHGRAPTDDEAAYAQAIAFLENQYGRAGQFAQFIANGDGYNWGSLERVRNADGTCPSGSVPGMDAANQRCFFVYPDDFSAAKAFVHNLTVSFPTRAAGILAAMNGGTPEDVATAMKGYPAYFEADAGTYGAHIRSALDAMSKANIPTPTMRQAAGGGFVLLLALAGGAYYLYRRPDIVRKIPLLNRL